MQHSLGMQGTCNAMQLCRQSALQGNLRSHEQHAWRWALHARWCNSTGVQLQCNRKLHMENIWCKFRVDCMETNCQCKSCACIGAKVNMAKHMHAACSSPLPPTLPATPKLLATPKLPATPKHPAVARLALPLPPWHPSR